MYSGIECSNFEYSSVFFNLLVLELFSETFTFPAQILCKYTVDLKT